MKFHLPVKITRALGKAGFAIKEASPKLLIFGGASLILAGGVVACAKTLNVESIIDEHLEEMSKIDEALEKGSTIQNEEYPEPTVYTEKIAGKDKFRLCCRTGGKILKNYILAALLIAAGFALIGKGTNTYDGRVAVATAAATAFEEKCRNMHDYIADKYGEEEAMKASTARKVKTETTTTDENGNEKKEVFETWEYGTPYGDYEILYDEFTTKHWDKSDYYNGEYIRTCLRTANDTLRRRGHLFLSEVYDMLGVDRTPASIVCGWIYDETKPIGEDQIQFIFRQPESREFNSIDNRPAHFIDFNCQGVIWNKISRYNAI